MLYIVFSVGCLMNWSTAKGDIDKHSRYDFLKKIEIMLMRFLLSLAPHDIYLGRQHTKGKSKDALLQTKKCIQELQSRGCGEIGLTSEVKNYLTSRKVLKRAI